MIAGENDIQNAPFCLQKTPNLKIDRRIDCCQAMSLNPKPLTSQEIPAVRGSDGHATVISAGVLNFANASVIRRATHEWDPFARLAPLEQYKQP
jgi:hypothetical protein